MCYSVMHYSPTMCITVEVYNPDCWNSDGHDVLQNVWVTLTFHYSVSSPIGGPYRERLPGLHNLICSYIPNCDEVGQWDMY